MHIICVVIAMEEGNSGDSEIKAPLPPPPPDYSRVEKARDQGINVNVIKPFKPSPRVSRIVPHGKCYYHPTKPASYICASCSKSVCTMCGTNISGVYFCPQCAPYRRTYAAPPPDTKVDNTSWYRAMLTIGVLFAIIGIILAVAYWPLTAMNAAEFENMRERYWDGGGHNFEDYTEGDVIVVRDTIVRIETDYDAQYGVVTEIWFKSSGKDDEDFTMLFDADLERDYHVGDEVAITLHVDEDTRTRNEVIRELHNNLPDISNIDHTISINIVFYFLIGLGAFLVLLYVLFSKGESTGEEDREEYHSPSAPEPDASPPEG